MTIALAVHIATAAPALLLGPAVLALRKGTRLHKLLGRIWTGLLAVSALTTIGVRGLDDGYSGIHLL